MRLPVALALAAAALVSMPAGITQAQITHTCFGEPATVVGTPGDDELQGDVVVGLAGSDIITGRLVCGGKDGDDYLSGYMVNAGPGDEREIFIHGPLAICGPGSDKFWDRDLGGAPRQVWRGGDGDDMFVPGGGEDVFYGGAGADRTGGGQPGWSEKLHQFGGDGNDILFGGPSKDKIYGEDGDDNLRLYGVEEDFVDGGPGFDTCIVAAGDRAVNCEDVTVVG